MISSASQRPLRSYGERIAGTGGENAYYVRPALCEMPAQAGPVLRETFAPILYAMRYSELDEAIRSHNTVGAGLSSSIFTLDVREAEKFASTTGSDCGIANVNIGPSGAEIGGAFGGDGWRPRSRLRCVEGLHASGHQHDQFRLAGRTTSARGRVDRHSGVLTNTSMSA